MLAPILALALAAPSSADGLVSVVRGAVDTALGVPSARAEVLAVDGGLPRRCAVVRADSPRPIVASGRAAVHLAGGDPAGRPCDGWVWARVRVKAPTLVTTRAVAEGEPLEGAVTQVEREVAPGRSPLAALPEGSRSARTLAAGAAVEAADIRIGPSPGEPVNVLLRAGALQVEERGRAVACRRGRACALLPSGRRVEGAWHEGRIVLDTP